MNSRQLTTKLDALGFALMRSDRKFWIVFNQDREWTCKNLKEVQSLLNAIKECADALHERKVMLTIEFDGDKWIAVEN